MEVYSRMVVANLGRIFVCDTFKIKYKTVGIRLDVEKTELNKSYLVFSEVWLFKNRCDFSIFFMHKHVLG